MRLLRLNDNGEFSFIEVVGAAIPPYAILSHIASAEEVSFVDIINGTGKDKKKLRKTSVL